MHAIPGRRAACLTSVLLFIALTLPTAVAAHAELESTMPEDGSTVETSPEVVMAAFSEGLEASKSSIEVVAPDGTTVATGGADADDSTMLVVRVPSLTPATYEVRWTAAADDGHLERGTFSFTVADAPSPALATPAAAASEPAAGVTPDGSSGGSESTGQILIIAVVGVALGIGIGWWRSRRAP